MKTIIWDFNGTILDDVDVAVKILNAILEELEYPQRFTVEQYKDIFTFPVIEYYIKAGFDFNKHSFEYIADIYFKYYRLYIQEAKINNNFMNLFNLFKDKGYKNVIISATRQDMLDIELDKYNMKNLFDEALGINDIYAKSKIELAINWNNNSKYANSDKIYIGDTVHDYEVANSIGCKSYIVSSGHQSTKVLLKNGIQPYKDLEEVLKCFV